MSKKSSTKKKQSRKYKHLTKKEKKKFAKAYIENDSNATQAYLTIRPETKPSAARVQASNIMKDVTVQVALKQALEELEITPRYILKNYKRAIESGLTKKATNKDALTGLRDLAKLSGLADQEKDDIESLQRQDLEQLSHNELLKQLEDIGNQIHELKRLGAISVEPEPTEDTQQNTNKTSNK